MYNNRPRLSSLATCVMSPNRAASESCSFAPYCARILRLRREGRLAYQKGEYIEVPVPEQMNIASMLIDENVTGGRADKKAICFAGEPPKYLPADLTYREGTSLCPEAARAGEDGGLMRRHRTVLNLRVSGDEAPHPDQCLFNIGQRGSITAADISLATLPEGQARHNCHAFLN